jgi:hypothetical protein
MQFSKQNNLIRVARVAGPSHNFLALELAETAHNTEVDELAGDGRRTLEPDDVRREVLNGVAEAARSLGLQVTVGRLKFVPSDTGPASIYRALAGALIEHFEADIRLLHPQKLAPKRTPLARRGQRATSSTGPRSRQHEA